MIAFATLFLGLILGVHEVTLVAGADVERIELFLDGASLGSSEEPPWTFLCDFGLELAPHRLEAVALASDGRELGRAVQRINLARGPAEASIALEGVAEGRTAVAHLSWESLVAGGEPAAVTATLDGAELPVSDPRRIELPPFDPRQLHLLRVELEFSEAVSAVAEATFGGVYGDRVQTEMVAIPIALEAPRERLSPADVAGWFARDGRTLEVLAIEKGPAEAVVVRDPAAEAALDDLAVRQLAALRSRQVAPLRGTTFRGSIAQDARFTILLKSDQRFRFVFPFPEADMRDGYGFLLFPPSRDFSPRDGGLLWVMSRTHPPARPAEEGRVAEAVAVSGMLAAARGRRRAVVLITGEGSTDRSRLAPDHVRRYLERLRVPLVVWTTAEGDPETAWGPATSVTSLPRLERAVRHLARLLDGQRVAWLAGSPLPHEVTLTERAEGARLAR